MKLSFVGTWAAVLTLVCAGAPLAAQQAGAGKLAYVNPQAILNAVQEGIRAVQAADDDALERGEMRTLRFE